MYCKEQGKQNERKLSEVSDMDITITIVVKISEALIGALIK